MFVSFLKKIQTYAGSNKARISKIINSNIVQLNANVNANERITMRFRTS